MNSDGEMLRVVEALEKAVESLTETVRIMHIAIFGRWDDRHNEMVPGLTEEVRTLNGGVDHLNGEVTGLLHKVEGNNRFVRRYLRYVVAPVLALLVAYAVGVPTRSIGDFVTTFVHAVARVGG